MSTTDIAYPPIAHCRRYFTSAIWNQAVLLMKAAIAEHIISTEPNLVEIATEPNLPAYYPAPVQVALTNRMSLIDITALEAIPYYVPCYNAFMLRAQEISYLAIG